MHYPLCVIFLIPLAYTPDRKDERLLIFFNVSSERHWQSGVDEIATKVLNRHLAHYNGYLTFQKLRLQFFMAIYLFVFVEFALFYTIVSQLHICSGCAR